MSERYLMKCGHVSTAVNESNQPVCPICHGVVEGWNEIDEEMPDLSSRKATCTYCKKVAHSSLELPFFSVHPEREFDDYYCGCRGWN